MVEGGVVVQRLILSFHSVSPMKPRDCTQQWSTLTIRILAARIGCFKVTRT
jgi:hypothetical protein